MEREIGLEITQKTEEILDRHYPVLVIDPYAVNIKDRGSHSGDVRLSFYSAFVAHAARELIEDGLVDEVIVFDDASFGPDYKSTGDLTLDYLTKDRKHKDGHVGPIIDRKRVHLYRGNDFASTSPQVEAVEKFLNDRGMNGQEVLYLGWDYHRERVQNHAKGFGVNVKYVAAENVHKFYDPDFDLERLYGLLPMKEIEKMEAGPPSFRRQISRYDRKGHIPRLLKPILGGSFMLDNKRMPDGGLKFDYRPGIDRLRELGMV